MYKGQAALCSMFLFACSSYLAKGAEQTMDFLLKATKQNEHFQEQLRVSIL
jgi:hypothetical protein